jgi:RNA polymerase sigma-70 factor, ECF subfamily
MLQGRYAPKLSANSAHADTHPGFACVPSRKAKHSSSAVGSSDQARPLEQAGLRDPHSSPLDQAIHLAQGGDAAAFEYIYRRHSHRVYALCLRLARDPVEAEDLTQEAFLQLFRKIHTFRGESAFSSWLYRLTANVAFMSFRKKKLPTDSLENPAETEDESGSNRREIGVIDLRLSGLFDQINLETAIERLPEGYKAMFLLHDVYGYDHQAIAAIRGCSVGNSKSQLHKARKRLREDLRAIKYELPAAALQPALVTQ